LFGNISVPPVSWWNGSGRKSGTPKKIEPPERIKLAPSTTRHGKDVPYLLSLSRPSTSIDLDPGARPPRSTGLGATQLSIPATSAVPMVDVATNSFGWLIGVPAIVDQLNFNPRKEKEMCSKTRDAVPNVTSVPSPLSYRPTQRRKHPMLR